MAKTFHLTIAKVGQNLFDGEARALTAPGSEGVVTILADHEAFVTPLKPGTIRVESESGGVTELLLATDGILEVSNNQATVII